MSAGGSAARFARRLQWWRQRSPRFGAIGHGFWWLAHNCVSHPILGIWPSRASVWFHDWTSRYLNCRTALEPSPPPRIPNWSTWAWHNVAGHLAIGLLPCRWTFEFHDRTSKAMNVPHWL